MILLAVLLALQDAPDVVTLQNGDTIRGTIVGLSGGVLTITTEYSKEIKIDATKIRSVATSKSATVELVDGEILKGKLKADEKGKLVVESDVAGQTKAIDLAQVKAINPPPVVPAKYRGAVALGGMLSRGNTDRMAITFSAEAERRTEDDRISLRFLWNYSEDDGVRSARNVFAGLKYDYFFSKWVYAYLSGELYSDEFKDLDLRATASLGIGWNVVDRPDLAWSLEGGIAYLSNNFDDGDDNSEIAMRAASLLRWQITEGVTFTDLMVAYPFREEMEFLWRNEATIAVALGAWLGGNWALKFSNILDYDSEPSGDAERLDVLWLLSLQYTFG